jgi:hypothetical protein
MKISSSQNKSHVYIKNILFNKLSYAMTSQLYTKFFYKSTSFL